MPSSTLVRPRLWVPILLASIAAAMYGTLSSLQWNTFFFPSWDLGIFSALMQQYADFSAPHVWIKGDHYNLLGDHFHPLLIILTPVWWVWPSPLALLWAQAVLLAVSAIPLTRYAMAKLGTVLGTIAGIAYLFSFGLQGTQNVQFHEYALAVPLLACGVTALLEQRVRAAVLWFAPLVFVKEDLGLTVMMLGFVGAWMMRDDSLASLLPARGPYDPPRLSREWLRALPHALNFQFLGLAAWGLVWFVLATFVFLPMLSPSNQYEYTNNFAALSGLMVPLDKWITAAMFVAFMGVVGLRSPLVLALLPTFAWRCLGNVPFYWTWEWHYNSILMPIAFGAFLHTVPSIRAVWKRYIAVGLCAASTAYLLSALPLNWIFTERFAPDSEYAASARAAVSAVPEGASVAADLTLLAPLVPHRSVQWIHGDAARAPDCVASRFGMEETEWAPNGLAEWANSTWPASSAPRTVQVNGAPVRITANSQFLTVYHNSYFQVACQETTLSAATN